MTDKEFCKMDTEYSGDEVDNINQIVLRSFNGKELKEYVEHCITMSNEANGDKPTDTRSHNVGESDYAKHKIQPWSIWEEYKLNPWDADVVKRILRDKKGESRKLDYEKIIHVCQERIRQIDSQE